eukprot:GHVQ01026903.1.p2 GENE.GHVQ01026903.1~~GHVQ01026903.1.p2  ORF type:complete len:228 (+),score=31.42 GHVQ01026903.1:291-974(+)
MLPQLEPHINPSDTAQRFTDSPLPSHLSCYSPRSPTISGPYGQVEKYDDDDELDEDSQNGEVWETQADDGVGMVSRKRNRKDAAERERLTATGTVGGIYANGGDKCDVESCQTTNEMEREPPRTLKQFVDGVIAKQKSEDKTHSGHSSTGMELPPHMIMIVSGCANDCEPANGTAPHLEERTHINSESHTSHLTGKQKNLQCCALRCARLAPIAYWCRRSRAAHKQR